MRLSLVVKIISRYWGESFPPPPPGPFRKLFSTQWPDGFFQNSNQMLSPPLLEASSPSLCSSQAS